MIRRLILSLTALAPAFPAAADYEVLHELQRAGAQPVAPLLAHSSGLLYGTTSGGGAADAGTVFRIDLSGGLTVLHSFADADGRAPVGALVEGDGGEIFGTASAGGAGGFGTAFKITTTGVFTKLADFSGGGSGSVPGSLLRAADGDFYGTSLAGGSGGAGTVFRMTPGGAVTTLAHFSGANGALPAGKLAIVGTALYGATTNGGSAGQGTVFRVNTNGTGFATMAHFNGTNGANPDGGPLLHSDGFLYGLTEFGGTNGFGTAYRLSTAATPALTVLRHFDDPDGSQPVGELAAGADGALYGMTGAGGFDGWGVCFRMTTAGSYSVRADFSGTDGALPGSAAEAGLIAAPDAFLYGVTSAGGPGNLGTVVRVPPGTGELVISWAEFSTPSGWTPSGAPTDDGAGRLLFPAAFGGAGGAGTLLRLDTVSGALDVVGDFDAATSGSGQDGGLVASSGGEFYGMTLAGGSSDRGVFYRYDGTGGLAGVTSLSTTGGSRCEGALIAGTDGAFFGVGREGGASGRGTFFRITKTGSRLRLTSFTGLSGAAPGQRPRGGGTRLERELLRCYRDRRCWKCGRAFPHESRRCAEHPGGIPADRAALADGRSRRGQRWKTLRHA